MTKQEIAKKISDISRALFELERYSIRDKFENDKIMMHVGDVLYNMSNTLDSLEELLSE